MTMKASLSVTTQRVDASKPAEARDRRGLAGMAAPPVCAGQPLRSGARSCQRAIIAMICHGGAIGPSRRTRAAEAIPSTDTASASAEPAGTIAGSIGSNLWAEMVPWTRSHSARALTRRIQPRTVSAGTPRSAPIVRWPWQRRWPARHGRRRRSRSRDARVPARAAARGSPRNRRSGPVAAAAIHVHQWSAANGSGRSLSVAAAQSSQDTSAPSPRDRSAPAPRRAPRSRQAPSRIRPSCRLAQRPGRGEWC